MNKKQLIVACAMGALLLSGCATAPSFDKISIGMPKQDVIKQLGRPESVGVKDNVEYLRYRNSRGFYFANDPALINPPEYFVRIVNGKVESYGRVGDFNTADVNLTVKSKSK